MQRLCYHGVQYVAVEQRPPSLVVAYPEPDKWSRMIDKEVAKDKYPRIRQACEKWGARQVADHLNHITAWYGGQFMTGVKRPPPQLLNTALTKFLVGEPQLPKRLYRGVLNQPGAEVVPAGKWTSWSDSRQIARDFAGGMMRRKRDRAKGGLLLQADPNALKTKAVLILWPAVLRGELGQLFGRITYELDWWREAREWVWVVKTQFVAQRSDEISGIAA